MKRFYVALILSLAVLCLGACQSAPTTLTAQAVEGDKSSELGVIVHKAQAPEASLADDSLVEFPQVDIEALPANAITAFTQGSSKIEEADFLPILSSSSGYTQKWEFYLDTRPIELRLKFEISNFAFTKNEGKIRGHVRAYDGDKIAYEIPISENYKSDQWSADTSKLDLNFGDAYWLTYADGHFVLRGQFKGGSFSYRIPLRAWKPQTGAVYFGNALENVYKYAILSYQQRVNGSITKDGVTTEVSGNAYANHYALTREIHNVFDEVADFRQMVGDLFVEYRYYVPSATYEPKEFGYLFVAYKGRPLISSGKIERNSLERWIDDGNYGYEIDARQEILITEGQNKARFAFTSARVEAKDSYADLSSFQRNVASRFAKPIEYSIRGNWELQLDVEGINLRIPSAGLVTITKLR